MNLEANITQWNQWLLHGEWTKLKQHLTAFRPESPADHRVLGHYNGLLNYYEGDVESALKILLETERNFGENISLLRDIVAFHYQMHEMVEFRSRLEQLELRLIHFEEKLAARTLFECELMLGKFLEEEARLAPALIFYEKALTRASSPAQRLRANMQKARWLALYDPKTELSNIYRELISTPMDDFNTDLQTELDHSLMLVELRLVGADHAWQRVMRSYPKLSEVDQRLFIFDFVEGGLSQDLSLPASVHTYLNAFNNLDPYESFVLQLAEQKPEWNPLSTLNELPARMPWASYLRLLCLSVNQPDSSSTRTELLRKIQLILNSLDVRSQKLWQQRLKQTLQTAEIKADFSLQKRSLWLQGKTIDLSKKKISQQLLSALCSQPNLTIDRAIELLWQTTFSPEHYHRLRMTIHRLNTIINDHVGLGKLIEVDSQCVRLRHEVRLRPVDSPRDLEFI